MITREDLIKIEQYLKRGGIRDTDFKLTANLQYDDIITIVQNGANKSISVKDFIASINDLSGGELDSNIVVLTIEPADGKKFTRAEVMDIYNKINNAPEGSIFIGYNERGSKFTLNVMEQPYYIDITYFSGDTVQRMSISKISLEIECSYISYITK